jgi:hypothetical protein
MQSIDNKPLPVPLFLLKFLLVRVYSYREGLFRIKKRASGRKKSHGVSIAITHIR